MEVSERRPEWPQALPRADASQPEPCRSGGVSNCYVFKSRLQEYAQKVGIPTPVYQTVKEGPSHEPVFKSSVIVNNVRYDSLPGFFNRKAAEQSAAEIALMEILKSGEKPECIPILHETGLCKNLLQEYAQKMNYAIPSYVCTKQPPGPNLFTCTVEIGGIQYIGAAARTKKEAEIKAARTALLAIQSSEASKNGASQYTVLPGKRKVKESETHTEAVKHLKPRKVNSKKKWSKRKFPRNKEDPLMKLIKDEGIVEGEGASTAPVKDVEIVEGSSNESKLGYDRMMDKPLIQAENLVMPVIGSNGHSEDSQQEMPNFVGIMPHNFESEVKVDTFDGSRDGSMMNPVFNGKQIENFVAGELSSFYGEEYSTHRE